MSESTWSFEAIGTRWQIDTSEPVADSVRASIAARIEEYDRTWSRFRDDAVIAAVRAGESVRLPLPEAEDLLGLYRRLALLTDGAVTPLVGATLEHLGYDRTYSFVIGVGDCVAPAIDELVWEPPVLRAPVGSVLDVGAAGKGQVAGFVAEELALADIAEFIVDAGGDLIRRGPAIRVGLEHPGDPTRVVGVAELSDAAIAASAPNRRWWGKGTHHVIDGRTGRPTTEVWATWAIAADPMVADGAATALFFTSPERVAEEFNVAWVTYGPGGLAASTTWPGEIFP